MPETAVEKSDDPEFDKKLIEQCIRNRHDEACLIQKEDIDK